MSLSESAALLAELGSQRQRVRGTLAGLTTKQMRMPVPPATWAPFSVLHHLALDVERWWFQAVVANDREAWQYFNEHRGGAWNVPAELDPQGVLDLYEQECAKSNLILADIALDDPAAAWPDDSGPPESVREIVLHVIVETAAHAGQLDIIRESIDGTQWLVLN